MVVGKILGKRIPDTQLCQGNSFENPSRVAAHMAAGTTAIQRPLFAPCTQALLAVAGVCRVAQHDPKLPADLFGISLAPKTPCFFVGGHMSPIIRALPDVERASVGSVPTGDRKASNPLFFLSNDVHTDSWMFDEELHPLDVGFP